MCKERKKIFFSFPSRSEFHFFFNLKRRRKKNEKKLKKEQKRTKKKEIFNFTNVFFALISKLKFGRHLSHFGNDSGKVELVGWTGEKQQQKNTILLALSARKVLQENGNNTITPIFANETHIRA